MYSPSRCAKLLPNRRREVLIRSHGAPIGGGGDPIRKGKGGTPCVVGTKKERKVLWECFGQGGDVKRGGYILRGQRNCMTTWFTK